MVSWNKRRREAHANYIRKSARRQKRRNSFSYRLKKVLKAFIRFDV